MADDRFKKYRQRLAREGIMKALMLSGSIALGVLALTVFLSWFFGFKAGLWLGLGLFVGILAVLAPLLYFKRYRPTVKSVARRVDELGLEERVITMTEFENDPTYVAERQRQDTIKALGTVDHMLIKFAVSATLIVACAVGLVFGASSVTVGALYVADVIPSGVTLALGEDLPSTYTLTYSVSSAGGGTIVMYTDDWENEQSVSEEIIVTEGENAPAVLAVEDDEHIFIGWSDGVTTAYRMDVNVKGNLKVEAVFLKYAESVEDPEDQRFNAPQVYRDQQNNDNNDNNNSNSDQPPFDSESQQQNSPMDPNQMQNSPTGNMTQTDQGNQIIDGQTFYGDTYEDSHGQALDRLGSDSSIPSDVKDGVTQYYDAIQQNSSQSGEGEGEGEGENGGGN